MNERRSQRSFVIVTLMTVVSVATVLIAYAAFLGTINSTGYVNVGGVGGSVYYSETNTATESAWTNNLNISSTSTAWYAKMNTTSGGYVGLTEFSWQLRQSTDGGSTWSDVGTATTFDFSLDGTVQTIYATADGTFGAGNRDWSLTAGYGTGLWKVELTINSKA